uniref:Uncharacterized protein n=1 Tax=Clandestinovirus TaxID=2831644 RepID=A0A8F8PKD3_9VIRU|nr:hypothetical protein KOM_12_383 [Clandestinovirus]
MAYSVDTLISNTLQTGVISVAYNNTGNYLQTPVMFYNQRLDNVSIAGGSTVTVTSLPAGFFANDGDVLEVYVEGNTATVAGTTRFVRLNVCGSGYETFNLKANTGGLWRVTFSIARVNATRCDSNGIGSHADFISTFGNPNKNTSTSFNTASGNILLQFGGTNAGDVIVNMVRMRYISAQS